MYDIFTPLTETMHCTSREQVEPFYDAYSAIEDNIILPKLSTVQTCTQRLKRDHKSSAAPLEVVAPNDAP